MIPTPEEDAAAAAEAIGLDLPDACIAGVIDNRRLLDSHLARLDAFLAEHPDA